MFERCAFEQSCFDGLHVAAIISIIKFPNVLLYPICAQYEQGVFTVLFHFYRVDSSTSGLRTGPLPIEGVSGQILIIKVFLLKFL